MNTRGFVFIQITDKVFQLWTQRQVYGLVSYLKRYYLFWALAVGVTNCMSRKLKQLSSYGKTQRGMAAVLLLVYWIQALIRAPSAFKQLLMEGQKLLIS
jgi:hypothetical protein